MAVPAIDPLARLKHVRTVLSEHRSGKCPKCMESSLTEEDTFDEERDLVMRLWTCSKCGYEARGVGMPIAEWKTTMQDRWYKKAAAQRAREALTRCPTCGNETIQAREVGVKSIGTSSHVMLSCKTPGCDFEERMVERSLVGTGRSGLQYAALLLIVIACAAIARWAYSALEKGNSPPVVPPVSPQRESAAPPPATTSAPVTLKHNTTASPPSAPLHVRVSGRVQGSVNQPLVRGMRLRSGDGITVRILTSAPANVYLLYCDAAGAMSLYPSSGSLSTRTMAALDVPAPGSMLTLDNHSGRDIFYVLASREPLAEADPVLSKMIAHARPGDRCGDELEAVLAGKPTPSTHRTSYAQVAATRGFEIKARADIPEYTIESGPDGVAVLPIWIDHQTR